MARKSGKDPRAKVPPKDVPLHVAADLTAMAEHVARLSIENPTLDLRELMDRAADLVLEEREKAQHETVRELEDVPCRRVASLRKEAGLTQQQLADAMQSLGFDKWNRGTVADIEREPDAARKRRDLSFGEMLGLSALFGVPMLDLLLPDEGPDGIAVSSSKSIGGARARELILGRDGRVGVGGPKWIAAASVAAGVERPARQLWRRRAQGDK